MRRLTRPIRRRAKLAKQALDLSPDCADAYVLLAEQARTAKEALKLFEQAVSAGERALGPETFQKHVGHFWGLLETRPYMRAREGLAHVLWSLGRREEAADHVREMLRLNPNDNQGHRYTLASWLLNLDQDDELAKLLKQYEEGSASWTYTETLLAFRQQGDTPAARKQLKKAQKANPHVPSYLLSEQPLPQEQPPYYSPGEESEAIIYAAGGLSAWRSTPGAITWLRKATKGGTKKKSKAKEPEAAGPSAVGKARLKRLPQELDIWQVDGCPLGSLVQEDHAIIQPWVAVVTSLSDELILAQEMNLEPPSTAMMWDLLAGAIGEPIMGHPHRPSQLQVRPGPIWDELRPHLEDLGIEIVEVERLELIHQLLDDLSKHLTGEEPSGLLEVPGMTPEGVASFYEAAAEFYQQAPWKRLGYEEAIQIDCDRYESGPWYAVVMGQSGLTLGVALYEDMNLLRQMWAGDILSEDEIAQETVALTVTFDPETEMPMADLLASREHNWKVAGPEAYPSVFRKEKGMSMRPPLAWELELLEGCLRSLPGFIAKRRPAKTKVSPVKVPVASGELTLVLSWVEEE